MTLIDFLMVATRGTFVVLGLVTLIDYLRGRRATRLDVALFFGSLAYVLGVQEIFVLTGVRPDWAVKSIQLATLAHAYLLLRVLDNLRPIARRPMQAALIGLVVAWGLWLVFATPPAVVNLASLAYMALVDGYAVVVLVRGTLLTNGVTRLRLRFAALGAGLLAAALVVVAVDVLLPSVALDSSYVVLTLAMCSGLAFYVGFAAPQRVRRLWQLAELERFLNGSQDAPAEEPVSAALGRLCQAGMRAVGGQAAFVVARPEPAAAWTVAAATERSAAEWWAAHWPAGWAAAAGQAGPGPHGLLADGTEAAAGPAGRIVLIVPIAGSPPGQQVLAVTLAHRPLFPEDDQSLLNMMCRHSALMLDQKRLIEQLREQNQELVHANQELEAFAYSVSHDLRTPLRHIEGFAELLRDSTEQAPTPVYLERILGATSRMGHMIDVFLSFSRLGQSDLALTRVPLAALVAQVKDEYEPETRQRQVDWRIGALPDVLGDPVLLRQAWMNLIGNALKYTRQRATAEIEVGMLPGDRGGQAGGGEAGHTTVFVRDNGVGFDPAYAGQLFTIFGRLHHASEFEGDGLGLAVVRRIVQRHGGRVWAEGRPGGGATFYMTLRLADGADRPAQGLAQRSAAAVSTLLT